MTNEETSRNLIERAAERLRQGAKPNVVQMAAERAAATSAPAAVSGFVPPPPSAVPPPVERPGRPLAGQPASDQFAPYPAVAGAAAAGQATSSGAGASRSREVTIDRGALARAGIVIPSTERNRLVEEFRIIKRQVVAKSVQIADAADHKHNSRVIMVTSARPREGKTFTAINLALAIASEHDLKVLLIDSDTQRRTMMSVFGITAEAGIVDLLGDDATDFSDIVMRTNLPNLSIIAAGRPNARVPELLSSRRARTLIDEMAQRYSDRFILFDAPPCLASSDPAILAGLVGQTVFVVEADQTQQEEIETALSLISACPNISLVLNKTQTTSADQFGSYSYY